MKLLLSNGADMITVGEFIKKNEFFQIFKMGIKDDNPIKKQFINPFELVLFEVVNSHIVITRLKKCNDFDEIVYIGE